MSVVLKVRNKMGICEGKRKARKPAGSAAKRHRGGRGGGARGRRRGGRGSRGRGGRARGVT